MFTELWQVLYWRSARSSGC